MAKLLMGKTYQDVQKGLKEALEFSKGKDTGAIVHNKQSNLKVSTEFPGDQNEVVGASILLFKVGIETPEDSDTAYSIIIPALCNDQYTTVSAADTFEEIVPMAREVGLLMMEEMALSGDLDRDAIIMANQQDYRINPEYADFDQWIEVDIEC